MQNLEQQSRVTNNHRSLWLELFKVFLFVGVVFIHVENKGYLIYLSRIAVPMFFVISGCYCSSPRKENETDESYYERKVKYAKKKVLSILKYLVFGLLLYYVWDIVYGFIRGQNIAQIYRGFFIGDPIYHIFIVNHVNNSGDHLWFLLALFTISIIHYLVIKFKIEKVYLFLPLLIIIFMFFGVYMYFYEGDIIWGEKVRNGIFFGLSCFSLGFDVHYLANRFFNTKMKKTIAMCISLPIALVLFFLQLLEQKLLGYNSEIYISGFLSTPFFMAFFLLCPSPDPKWYELIFGKKFSFLAYIFHRKIGFIVGDYGIANPLKTVLTILLSLLISLTINWIVILISFLIKKIRKQKACIGVSLD